MRDTLRGQVRTAARHLLSQQDRNYLSPTEGCFDRRYWGWKLVDFPEATYQRAVHPLALLYADPESDLHREPFVRRAVLAGMRYAAGIQHTDGSWDQAFPHEHSFGATAFLLESMAGAYEGIASEVDAADRELIEGMLRRAADFLCTREEQHGHIANHLAGASLGLCTASELFDEPRFRQRGEELVRQVLQRGSPEGWFMEYDGADPGYQTLCLQYLAQVQRRWPTPETRDALLAAVEFLAHFVHPDGTFGGEYGARRTAVFYPGGFATLEDSPLAAAVLRAMQSSAADGRTTGLVDVDQGNLTPLLTGYVVALNAPHHSDEALPALPHERPALQRDFASAGIHVRGTNAYYAVFGAANGGVLKVFDKGAASAVWDDGGYLGESEDGTVVTTQLTTRPAAVTAEADEIRLEAPFYHALRSLPTPARFIVLRALNLSLMRNIRIGNAVKRRLVRLLVSGKRPAPLRLERRVRFGASSIGIEDVVVASEGVELRSLQFGMPFSGIHMASAGYLQGAHLRLGREAQAVDVTPLRRIGEVRIHTLVEVADA